jgi:hypothetical protein
MRHFNPGEVLVKRYPHNHMICARQVLVKPLLRTCLSRAPAHPLNLSPPRFLETLGLYRDCPERGCWWSVTVSGQLR